jgi:pimeloyl-ACP methyl ester carboxylesterase
VERQFVGGSQDNLHVRWCGQQTAPAVLVIHDAPGSSEQLVPLLEALGGRFFAIAPDLPGCGESDALAGSPDVAAFAGELLRLLDGLGLAQVRLLGLGFGSSVALEMARLAPERCQSLTLCGILLPTADERVELAERLAPAISIADDGSHWYRTWLMLRDSQIYWPWFDRTVRALRRVPADFSGRSLHRWTMDVMRAHDSYHQIIDAALANDAAKTLAGLAQTPVLLCDPARPLSAYDQRAAALRPDATVAVIGCLADYAMAISLTARSGSITGQIGAVTGS